MGYYTRYRLEYDEKLLPDNEVDNLIDIIDELPIHDYSDSCKWYEHEEEMVSISEQFPTILFILSGEGEESGDIWRKYFKNGKVQVAEAKITFDECKL